MKEKGGNAAMYSSKKENTKRRKNSKLSTSCPIVIG